MNVDRSARPSQPPRARERGVALVQVLLITGIIGLLMLQLALTAREQVTRAMLVADRVEAELRLRSREAAVVYTLLTLPWARDPKSTNPYAANWNFSGQPVAVDGALLTLQDQAGLMPVPRVNAPRFTELLQVLGAEPLRAAHITEELLVRHAARLESVSANVAADRGTMSWFPVQTLDELQQLPDMDDALYRKLEPLLTLFPNRNFNPLTAPVPVLAAHLPPYQVAALLDLRARGQLDLLSYFNIAGEDSDEFTAPTAGPGVGVDIALEYGTASAHAHLVIAVDPYDDVPIAIWERSGRGARP